MRSRLLLVSSLLLAACGARSALLEGGATGGEAEGGGGSVGRPDGGPSCQLDDLTTWQTERYVDDGDYERAAVALSGLPWVALKVKGGGVALVNLGLDDGHGIAFVERIDIPDSPVYPVALDVDDRRFVMLTTSGLNWNGDVELWRIDRADGTVTRAPVGDPASDPAYTVSSTMGIAGDDVVIGYARAAENQGTIELRNDQLQIVQSLPVGATSFTAVRTGAAGVDVYAGQTTLVHAESGSLSPAPADPAWQVIGGLDGFLVEIGDQIRMTHGADTWTGAWPHSQISPPAVVRLDDARAAFSLETELTAVVGHVNGASLDWLQIEPAPGASGMGLGLLPVIEPGRLGLFYLGLEIPSPQQPLRYYGLVCH